MGFFGWFGAKLKVVSVFFSSCWKDNKELVGGYDEAVKFINEFKWFEKLIFEYHWWCVRIFAIRMRCKSFSRLWNAFKENFVIGIAFEFRKSL